ncbi:MAG: hypothetical protein ACLSG9_11500 [Eubacterium sp.]
MYNGPAQRPEREVMKLSDAFANQDVEGCLELKVEILNINYGKNESLQKACKTLEDYAILVAKIREYAREMDDLSMAVHKAIQYCIDHDHLRDFLILNQAEVAAMSLLEGSWEEYADSMDQELERLKESEKKLKESEKALKESEKALKESEKALKKEVLEKDAELERVSREKDTELKRISSEKDARIKELEALLASKQ